VRFFKRKGGKTGIVERKRAFLRDTVAPLSKRSLGILFLQTEGEKKEKEK